MPESGEKRRCGGNIVKGNVPRKKFAGKHCSRCGQTPVSSSDTKCRKILEYRMPYSIPTANHPGYKYGWYIYEGGGFTEVPAPLGEKL